MLHEKTQCMNEIKQLKNAQGRIHMLLSKQTVRPDIYIYEWLKKTYMRTHVCLTDPGYETEALSVI